MDYKEKYEMALERAEGIIKYYKERNRDEAAIEDLQEIFPELKDSDDEEIRKDIVTYLLQLSNSATLKVNAQKFNKWIAWLEKQVEQKPADDVKPKFKHGDRPNNEKKIAWSEEEKSNMDIIVSRLEVDIEYWESRSKRRVDEDKRIINWLKSIKERVIWKPSDKQIRALRWVLNNIPYNTHKEEISGLLDQIKDL